MLVNPQEGEQGVGGRAPEPTVTAEVSVLNRHDFVDTSGFCFQWRCLADGVPLGGRDWANLEVSKQENELL